MGRNQRLYVVDDNAAVRTSIVFALSTLGFEPRPIGSGTAFLDIVDELAPGCVLLDVRMPDIDGLQVIEALGARIRQFPVIVMTGHGDIVTAVKAMKLGASDFIEKPFKEDLLVEILTRLFAGLEHSLEAVDHAAEARRCIEQLSRREADVLRGLAAGLSNKVIAYRLDLSVRTVEMHRASMMHRLGVRSLPDALRMAFLAGTEPLLEPKDA